ncbi:heparinase II/III family protein [Pelagicoccus sp. SDUM812005]|uniref:heparinase II/III domain-containing protein n=1 Tax=Pelagicoccus sp. SDUM812005 TaxID=3041257 RepID=UPI00280D33D1|nr:heparinase II/III family protein [Pelagicoccus sp. SDUM812005]MDQ8183661.1 heparinase II/III family protein [Pelagicoccus sp. SDUM812005]
MTISRRDALKWSGIALAGATILPLSMVAGRTTPRGAGRLFFDKEDIPRIRSNARSELLGPTFREWAATSPQALVAGWSKFAKTGNIVYDMRDFWAAFEHSAVVYIVEPTDERREALLEHFEKVVALPKWDYLMDGDEDIGLLRAAMAVSRLLFIREALGDDFGSDLNERFLSALASKGAVPCYRTIQGMNNPDTVKGWRYDPQHPQINDFSLENWPYFLGRTNLRGTSTMGLGLAALALEGRDPRCEEWLKVAVDSTYQVLSEFSPNGSYSEGLSYGAYALRLVLQFCEAHYRVRGDIDWSIATNWSGIIDDVAVMQAGKNPDGTPDVVNFSDARASIHPCVGSWIRERTGDEAAQYATKHFASPGYFLDYLWYRPAASGKPPRQELLNYRTDLDWVICRSGWGEQDAVLAFRSGNPANHEHADRNSFLYKAFGERLLNDPFGAAYERRDPKWTLRMTKAHNAILIGGRGHQYHEGEEGVNAGQAKAEIVSYVDDGKRVSWTSDATHAYRLANANVSKVLRTVVFLKPHLIVVLDQVELKSEREAVEVRYFPDNRDGSASVTRSKSRFELKRPGAALRGGFAANTPLSVRTDQLDFSEDLLEGVSLDGDKELGDYPFVAARSSPALRHELCTVMLAQGNEVAEAPAIEIRGKRKAWHFEAAGVKGILDTSGEIPRVKGVDEV